MAIYPFNFVNKRGIPAVRSNSVAVGTTNVVFTFSPHSFAGIWGSGLVLIDLAQAIPTGTTGTLPLVFETNGIQQAVTTYGGTAVTAADFTGEGVYLFFYDKAANNLQLMTGVV